MSDIRRDDIRRDELVAQSAELLPDRIELRHRRRRSQDALQVFVPVELGEGNQTVSGAGPAGNGVNVA